MRKSFKGILENGDTQRIRLKTIKGKVGYRIRKFEIIGELPGQTSQKIICKIYKTDQGVPTGTVNFSNDSLLAVSIWFNKSTIDFPQTTQVIFDLEVFNQDIYISAVDVEDGVSTNYYLELEAIDLSEQMAEYTTIQSLRTSSTY